MGAVPPQKTKMFVSNDNKDTSAYNLWTITLNAPIAFTENAGNTVVQNSANGVLNVALDGSSTSVFYIYAAAGQVFDLSGNFIINSDSASTVNAATVVSATAVGYSGAADESIVLVGGPYGTATVTALPDDLTFYITLSEAQRVRAIELSATPGGDGTAMFIDFAVFQANIF